MLGDVLDGDQALEFKGVIDHQQALQAVLVEQLLGLFQRGTFAHGDEALARRHDFAHGHVVAGFKTQIAPGDDAHDLAVVHHRKAAHAQLVRQVADLPHGVLGRDDHRIAQHARFMALDFGHLRGLLLRREVFVNDAHAAFLRHGNGQARFRHRIHRGGQQRQIQADVAGELGGEIGVLGQDLGESWHQQHIVEGERIADQAHGVWLRKK